MELSDHELEDLDTQSYAWEDNRLVCTNNDSLQDVLMTNPDVEPSDCTLGAIGESGVRFEAVDPDLEEESVFDSALGHKTGTVMKEGPSAGRRVDKFGRGLGDLRENWVMMLKKLLNEKCVSRAVGSCGLMQKLHEQLFP